MKYRIEEEMEASTLQPPIVDMKRAGRPRLQPEPDPVQEVGELTFTNGRSPLVLDVWWTPARPIGWEIAGAELPHIPVRLEVEVAIKPINLSAKGTQTVRIRHVSYPEGMEVTGKSAAWGTLRDLVLSEVQRRVPIETIRCTADVFHPSEKLAQWVRVQLEPARV